jgi:hypothetical protein
MTSTGAGRGRERDVAPAPDEQAAVTMITTMRAGGASYREIVTALDGAGLKPLRAATWSSATVRGIWLRESGQPQDGGSEPQ